MANRSNSIPNHSLFARTTTYSLACAVLLGISIFTLTGRCTAQAVEAHWKTVDPGNCTNEKFRFDGAVVSLSDDAPADIALNANVHKNVLFTQWLFGDASSNPVAVLLETDNEQILRLFVDADRNRVIDDSEEVTTTILGGQVWISELDVHVDSGKTKASRQVAFSLVRASNRLRITTLGFASGKTKIGRSEFEFRRIDLNGNGLPIDSGDQVWIDLNRDGKFDSIDEQFGFKRAFELAGNRYTVRSDQLGERLQLKPDDGLGHVEFAFELADPHSELISIEGSMQDVEGCLVPIRLSNTPLSIPAGRYQIGELLVVAKDAEDAIWRMALEQRSDSGWFEVKANKKLKIELLKELNFLVAWSSKPNESGVDQAYAKAQFQTPDGLVMTNLIRIRDGETESDAEDADVTAVSLKYARAGEKLTQPQLVCIGFR